MSWKVYLLSLPFILASCDLVNPEEAVPAYLEINEFTFSTDMATQGSSSSKITEVWLFVDGEFKGAYDLPALIPVLKKGPTEIRLEAGIKENGRRLTPDIYPFYSPFTVDVTLEANKTETISPVTNYLPETKFSFIEDYEDNRIRVFTDNITGDQSIIRTPDDAFEGQYSGQFYLTKDRVRVVEFSTPSSFSGLMENGVYVYLEVNYKSEVPVAWGVVGQVDVVTGLERSLGVGFSANDEWNKIYLNISKSIVDSRLDDYKIAFQAFLLEESPDSANVLIDNIKLVHF